MSQSDSQFVYQLGSQFMHQGVSLCLSQFMYQGVSLCIRESIDASVRE